MMRNIQEQTPKYDGNDMNYIYLFRNADKELLYVGIAMDPYLRFRQHKKDKEWFDEVKTVDCAVFSGPRYTVELVENSLIEELNPLYNIKQPETHQNKVDPNKITYYSYDVEQFTKKNRKPCFPQPAETVMRGYKVDGFIELLGVKEHQLSKVRKVFARYGELFQNKSLDEMTLDSNDRRVLAGIYRSLSWTMDELTQKDEALLQDALRSKESSEAREKQRIEQRERYIEEQKEKREQTLGETRKYLAECRKKQEGAGQNWYDGLSSVKENKKKSKPAPKTKKSTPKREEPKSLEKEFDAIDDLNHTISILRLAIRQRDNEIDELDEKNLALEIEIIKLQNQLKERSIWRKIVNLFKR